MYGKFETGNFENNGFENKPTAVQICRLENIEHKSMKQVSYSGKYSLSASGAHHSHLQFSFVVRDAFSTLIKYLHMQKAWTESIPYYKRELYTRMMSS